MISPLTGLPAVPLFSAVAMPPAQTGIHVPLFDSALTAPQIPRLGAPVSILARSRTLATSWPALASTGCGDRDSIVLGAVILVGVTLALPTLILVVLNILEKIRGNDRSPSDPQPSPPTRPASSMALRPYNKSPRRGGEGNADDDRVAG